jgi:hypothetical protein
MQKVLNGGKLSARYLASMGKSQGTLRISPLINHRKYKTVITRQARLALRLCLSSYSRVVTHCKSGVSTIFLSSSNQTL